MSDYPLVSAIMLAGHSNLKDVLAGIKCFREQTYPYKELIIVNNAKTQFDAAALNIHAEPNVILIDTPIHYFAGMARNFGISTANGQIIAQFDPDYWYAPNRLEMQIVNLASNEANVVVLASTMQYSYISGRASYQRNDQNAILNTMLFVRPQGLDYPNVDKQEELGLLQKFKAANAKIFSLPAPEVACKLLGLTGTATKPINAGLTKPHFNILKKLVKNR